MTLGTHNSISGMARWVLSLLWMGLIVPRRHSNLEVIAWILARVHGRKIIFVDRAA